MIGVFHPFLNVCGGAEYVAINIINTLKNNGYAVATLTNERVDHTKILNFFGESLEVDKEYVIPYRTFFWGSSSRAAFRVYADMFAQAALRLRFNMLIDSSTNSIFPWSDISYIHYPYVNDFQTNHWYSYAFHLPYLSIQRRRRNRNERIILANSRFTAEAINETWGIQAYVLHPPVQVNYFSYSNTNVDSPRGDFVVTTSRFSSEKQIDNLPRIAKLTDGRISFVVVGATFDQSILDNFMRLSKELGVSKRIIVSTNVTRERLRNILWSAKAYLHVNRNEAFGISIIEAMAAGCIPVVPDSGGPKEFVPKHLRYKTLEDAVHIVEHAVNEWSPHYAKKTSSLANRFDKEEFSKKLMTILQKKNVCKPL